MDAKSFVGDEREEEEEGGLKTTMGNVAVYRHL